MSIVDVGTVSIGGDRLVLFSGTPSWELIDLCDRLNIGLIFKVRIENANWVRSTYGMPIAVGVYDIGELQPAVGVADMLNISALLVRQLNLVVAASNLGAPLNIQKGPHMEPGDLCRGLTHVGVTSNIMVTERGSAFGYGRVVNDMRSIPVLQEFGIPVGFDGPNSIMPDERDLLGPLTLAAVAAGANAVRLETTNNKTGPYEVSLGELESILRTCVRIRAAIVASTKSGGPSHPGCEYPRHSPCRAHARVSNLLPSQ